ncbi:MAG TPA: nicotinamide riboside transporter PnuC, partial [Armatimonadota bacterium]
LFLSTRLYGDMGLQVVYIGLAVHGWCQWLCGGANKTVLQVSHTSWQEGATLIGLGMAITALLTGYFIHIHDTAPFLDALTTVLSLIAQYLLNYKRLENWYIWIAADVIYVGLYAYKGLFLTAVLYAVFIAMCVAGLRAWRASLREQPAVEAAIPAVS